MFIEVNSITIMTCFTSQKLWTTKITKSDQIYYLTYSKNLLNPLWIFILINNGGIW